MADALHPDRSGSPARTDRAVSPVVGVVLLVGATVLLAASVGTAVTALDGATTPDEPRLTVSGTVRADDGYPDGQTVRLRHRGGEALAVSRLALVVTVADGRRGRASGFPTLRLTASHRSGDALFDRSYAGVDGALDASTTDGTWHRGDVLEVRLARRRVDVQPDDRVTVALVHQRAGVLARLRLLARTGRHGP